MTARHSITHPDDLTPALYVGRVMHKRLVPFQHRFDYRVFSLWLDLDRIAETAEGIRVFSYNRFNIVSFNDADHGPRDGTSVRDWIRRLLADHNLLPDECRIMVQCYPRLFGYVFNPLSVFYIYDLTDAQSPVLSTIIYEVKNTFGDQHCYVIPIAKEQKGQQIITQSAQKGLYVSPFLPIEGHYRFRLNQPGQRLTQLIRQSGAITGTETEQMIALFTAGRQRLTDGRLLQALMTHPLMTLKVMAGIHWEALKLWRKGAKFHSRPAPPAKPATLVMQDDMSRSPRLPVGDAQQKPIAATAINEMAI
jgi:uncharacterized protein